MNISSHDPARPESFAPEEFLHGVGGLIDWAALAPAMAAVGERAGKKLPVSAVKIALLKQWYDLADTLTEFTVLDRLSFRRFIEFAGDGSAGDVEIIDELRDGMWTEQRELRTVVDAVEQQLRARGYSVQPGFFAEASIVPCTEGELPEVRVTDTAVPRPGELGRMLEAATAKAHTQGCMPTGPQSVPEVRQPRMSLVAASADPKEAAGEEAEVRSVRVRARLEWPWGQCSELTDVLPVGRDFSYSPFARELTPYTHVSRRHAELLVHGDGVWIKDLGSRNGTYVNDDQVPKGQAFLIDSDSIIRFGPLLAVSVKILP